MHPGDEFASNISPIGLVAESSPPYFRPVVDMTCGLTNPSVLWTPTVLPVAERVLRLLGDNFWLATVDCTAFYLQILTDPTHFKT